MPNQTFTIPPTMRRWALRGAGMENLTLETVSTPEPGPSELLVRHDACGICYSDIKIINLGPNHPRLAGRDMQSNPVIIGHEVSLTVVKVGDKLVGKYEPGQRFTVQVDAFYKDERLTYGYKLDGAMAQYGIIGKEILDGDEGCYLLPLDNSINQVAAALIEPWACVTAAYRERATKNNTVIIDGSKSTAEIEQALSSVAPDYTVEISNRQSAISVIEIDIGRIHYDGISIVGVPSGGLDSAHLAYTFNTRTDLKPGGKALFIGAGGPMGQMHVQRALTHPNPPSIVVITDINKQRLDEVAVRYRHIANENDIAFYAVLSDPSDETHNHQELRQYGDFDDIVSLVPSAEIVPFGLMHLAENGVFNVFAGVAKGSFASIDIGRLIKNNQRIIGTTGSTIADMRHTLEQVESGALDTNLSLAAIGGLDSLRDGLDAVKSGALTGKVVIFPNINNLPLTTLSELAAILPRVHEKLGDDCWTPDAEQALFDSLHAGS